jgi:NADPH:quinone reductase-like Zn-dependent oxidoreductase
MQGAVVDDHHLGHMNRTAISVIKGVSAVVEEASGIIPGITAHRAVHSAGPVAGRTVLVQGGAGAVGWCAVELARLVGGSRRRRSLPGRCYACPNRQ